MGNRDTYKRSGGKKRSITRDSVGQAIPACYDTSLAGRIAYNSKVNQVYVNRGRCKR